MNTGKRFEQQFKKSIPKEVFYYRFKDSSSSWGANSTVRYTPNNICDCMLYDGYYLYFFELKNTKGKSLPLANIRENQIKELSRVSKYSNVISGLVIMFSEVEECYFIEINDYMTFINTNERKSIPIDYLKNHGIRIECSKKKVNYNYDIKKFLDNMVIRYENIY